MRAVVSGAAGFLGSHLCRRLLGRGAEVVGVDDLSTGRLSNVTELASESRFSFREHDVCNPIELLGDVDFILHFASPASPADFERIPQEIMRVNSRGTEMLLELAKEKRARFLFASTSEVYGDPLSHPQHESYRGNVNPIGLRAVYDESKRYGEALTFSYHRKHDVDVRVVRIFNTYGPGMRVEDGRVVTNFIAQAMLGKPLTIHGDGSQTRSFLYVDDAIKGFLALLESDVKVPVNIGNPHEVTIAGLAERVIALTESESSVVNVDVPEDDPVRRCPDISRASELLGWAPSVSLDDGLRRTIADLRSQIILDDALAGVS